MSNEQTIVIKLDAKEIIEELVKLREEITLLRMENRVLGDVDSEGMPEIKQ